MDVYHEDLWARFKMTSGIREEVMFVTTFASQIKVTIGAVTKKQNKDQSRNSAFSFFDFTVQFSTKVVSFMFNQSDVENYIKNMEAGKV